MVNNIKGELMIMDNLDNNFRITEQQLNLKISIREKLGLNIEEEITEMKVLWSGYNEILS